MSPLDGEVVSPLDGEPRLHWMESRVSIGWRGGVSIGWRPATLLYGWLQVYWGMIFSIAYGASLNDENVI